MKIWETEINQLCGYTSIYEITSKYLLHDISIHSINKRSVTLKITSENKTGNNWSQLGIDICLDNYIDEINSIKNIYNVISFKNENNILLDLKSIKESKEYKLYCNDNNLDRFIFRLSARIIKSVATEYINENVLLDEIKLLDIEFSNVIESMNMLVDLGVFKRYSKNYIKYGNKVKYITPRIKTNTIYYLTNYGNKLYTNDYNRNN